VVNINDVVESIKLQLRDFPQETRIRQLYDRASAAYQTDRTRGIKTALESDWNKLKTNFEAAAQKVKEETGLF
jgi:hypothetical protein